jgi:hypothetical protein
MKRTKSYFIHGFNEDKQNWDNLFSHWEPYKTLPKIMAEKRGQTVKYDTGAEFPTEIIEWKSGKVENSLFSFIDLCLNKEKIFDYWDIWDTANKDAIELGVRMARHINKFYTTGEKIILSAHSLGSVAVLEIAKNLNPEINIYLFMMGGSASVHDYNHTIDNHKNIKLVNNIYSTKDFELSVLKRQHPTLHPIGTTALSPNRITVNNFEASIAHSDYKKNNSVQSIFRDFTKAVANHN